MTNQVKTLTYSIVQPKLAWYPHDDHEIGWQSEDGKYEILQDPVYGYFTLRLSEDPTESISEHRSELQLMLYVDALLQLFNVKRLI